jgi:hypothetical protein
MQRARGFLAIYSSLINKRSIVIKTKKNEGEQIQFGLDSTYDIKVFMRDTV